MSNPSPAYIAALDDSKAIHKGKQFTGKFLRPHAPFIKEIIDRLGVKTILDYGCGKGQQYEWIIPSTGQTIEQFWGVDVTKYDPAYPPFAAEPQGTFDLVICTQVLGTIPTTDHKWVIDRLHHLAVLAIYVSERLGEARKEVGDPAHRAFDYNEGDWMRSLGRDPELSPEITAAFRRTTTDGQKITRHYRFPENHNGGWKPVIWPEGIRAMNHKWAP